MAVNTRKERNVSSVHPDLFPGWSGKWSEWHTVISMKECDGFKKRSSEKGDLLGFRATQETLRGWFGDYDDGIYEWRTAGPRGGNPKVVYVGKTSSKGDESLIRRIQCYTRYQSHERVNINKTLEAGLQLQVRVLPCEATGMKAELMEDEALKAYRYDWNDMNQKN